MEGSQNKAISKSGRDRDNIRRTQVAQRYDWTVGHGGGWEEAGSNLFARYDWRSEAVPA